MNAMSPAPQARLPRGNANLADNLSGHALTSADPVGSWPLPSMRSRRGGTHCDPYALADRRHR